MAGRRRRWARTRFQRSRDTVRRICDEARARRLRDLLDPFLDDALPELPPPLAAALETAFLRIETAGSTPDRRAISLAALEMLRIISTSGPILLAIDDLQWLDHSSARVLEFCARRIHDEQLGILASLRIGRSDPDVLLLRLRCQGHRCTGWRSAPCREASSAGSSAHGWNSNFPGRSCVAYTSRLAVIRSMPSIAREVLRRGVPVRRGATRSGRPDRPAPTPGDGAPHRYADDPPGRSIDIASHSTGRPICVEFGDRADSALALAESAAWMLPGDDVIRFAHPLLASAVYASATTEVRLKVHSPLAEHVDHPEEQPGASPFITRSRCPGRVGTGRGR